MNADVTEAEAAARGIPHSHWALDEEADAQMEDLEARAHWTCGGRRIVELEQHLLRCYESFPGMGRAPPPAGLQDRVRTAGPAALLRPVRTDIRRHSGHALRFHEVSDLCLACGRVSQSGREQAPAMARAMPHYP